MGILTILSKYDESAIPLVTSVATRVREPGQISVRTQVQRGKDVCN